MNTATLIATIVGSAAGVVGVIAAIWFGINAIVGRSFKTTVKGNTTGPVATGDNPNASGRDTIVAREGSTVTVTHSGMSDEEHARLARVEEQLDYLQQQLAPPAPGSPDIDVEALALEATNATERLLQEAVELQRQHRQRDAIERLLTAYNMDLSAPAKVQLHILAGKSFLHLSELEEAESHYRQALAAAQAGSVRSGEANALGNLGIVHGQRGAFDRAEQFISDALVIHQEMGDRLGEAADLGNLGNILMNRGAFDRAERCYRDALVIDREIGNQRSEAQDLGNLANVYKGRGDLGRAEDFVREALAIQRRLGNRLSEANQLGNLGNIYSERGDSARAEEHYAAALEIQRDIGYRLGEAISLGNLGHIHWSRGELDRAEQFCQNALTLHREIGFRLGEANALGTLGLIAADQSKRIEACNRLKEAAAIYARIGAGGEGPEAVHAKLRELGGEEDKQEA